MLARKTAIYIASYLSVLVTLGLLAYYADDRLGFHKLHPKKVASGHAFMTELGYVDLPRMNLTMTSPGTGKTGRLTLDITLEVAQKNSERVRDYQPIITDKLLAFTREQDVDSLRDPVNQKMFKAGLFEQAQKLPMPFPVMDIVIRRMLIL